MVITRSAWTVYLSLTCLLPGSLKGQENIFEFSLFQPVRTADAERVPDSFQIFVPDAAGQILVNPARAARYAQRFVYLHRRGFINRSLSFSSLSNEWLINIDARIRHLDRFSETSDSETRTLPNFRTSTVDRLDDNRTSDNRLQLSFTNFSKTVSGSSSLGFFLVVRHVEDNSISDRVIDTFDLSRSGTTEVRFHNETRTLNDTRIRQTGYALGAQFSMAGNNWDLTGRIGLHKASERSNFEGESSNVRTDTTIDGTPVNTFSSDNTLTTDASAKQDPLSLELHTYFQKESNWPISGSHMFISLAASIALRPQVRSELLFMEEKLVQRNDQVQESSLRTVEDFDTRRNRFNKFSGSAGWVWTREMSRFYAFGGVGPKLTITDSNLASDDGIRIPLREPLLLTEKQRLTDIELVAPVYVSLAATSWLDIYSWFEFLLGYTRIHAETRAATAGSDTFSGEQHDTTLLNAQNIHLGFRVEHPSGFVAHVDLSGELDSVRGWLISMGYLF